MLKKFARFLPILIAVLIVFSLVQSAPVQAEDPVYDQQVLIVHYVDRDQLADLANRYDVVEVDSDTQTVKIFSRSRATPWLRKALPGLLIFRIPL